MPSFDLQGHRGARGLKPENTLPAFETAFDLGVTSIETDIQLTRDGVPILYHDAQISERLCRLLPRSTAPDPTNHPLVSSLTLSQLRSYKADVNPDPKRFPQQEAMITPLARLYADRERIDPYALPALTDLFAFAQAYAGEMGAQAGKTDEQRRQAHQMRFDLELKRVPFHASATGDDFDGSTPGLLEQRLLDVVRAAGVVERTQVRSFDHRSVRTLRRMEPKLTAAVLIAETAPVAPAQLAQLADAQVYAPDYQFLDPAQVRQIHAVGVRVVPWTINETDDWLRLLDWGVDGITTDYPDRLAALLRARGIAWST